MGFHRSEIALPCQQESSSITYFFTCNLAPKLDCTSTGQKGTEEEPGYCLYSLQLSIRRQSVIHQGSERKHDFHYSVAKAKAQRAEMIYVGSRAGAVSTALLLTMSPRHTGQIFCWEFFCFAFSFPRNFLLGTFLFVIQPAGCLSCRQSYFISNFFSLLYFVKTHAKFLSSSRKIQ